MGDVEIYMGDADILIWSEIRTSGNDVENVTSHAGQVNSQPELHLI